MLCLEAHRRKRGFDENWQVGLISKLQKNDIKNENSIDHDVRRHHADLAGM
jgi:hypothetical protein